MMRSFLSLAAAVLAIASPLEARAGTNTDEAQVPPYTLPDPLVTTGGERITTAAAWFARRSKSCYLSCADIGRTSRASERRSTRAGHSRRSRWYEPCARWE